MKWLRDLFPPPAPQPQSGQVWRSAHSGRAIRITDFEFSDSGQIWRVGIQHETRDGAFNCIPITYYMTPAQWRRKIHAEARTLESK